MSMRGIVAENLPFYIDREKRTLHFNGRCPDIVPVCGAICCREWFVVLSREETESGHYLTDLVCDVTQNPCTTCRENCLNRSIRLRQTTEKSCIYLNAENGCSIYEYRPVVCREFNCFGGWHLATAQGEKAESGGDPAKNPIDRRFLEVVDPETVFVPNRHVTLTAVFFDREAREAVFVKRSTEKCGVLTAKAFWDSDTIDDQTIVAALAAFDTTKPLGAVLATLNADQLTTIGWDEFLKLTALLRNQHLLIYKA